MDTSGFYKLNVNKLMYAPNFVYAPKLTLLKEEKDKNIYPIDGWEWFDSEESARKKYNFYTTIIDLKEAIQNYKTSIDMQEKEKTIEAIDEVIKNINI